MNESSKATERDIIEMLKYIPITDYNTGTNQELGWYEIVSTLKKYGIMRSIVESWSSGGNNYDPANFDKVWNSISGTTDNIGIVINKASERGYQLPYSNQKKEYKPIKTIKNMNDLEKMYLFVDTLFQDNENINYCVDNVKNENGKYIPKGYGVNVLAKDLKEKIKQGTSIEDVIGKYNKECGVWVRINPTNTNGVSDSNITNFNYSLVECDSIPVEEQLRVYKEMNLPIATLTLSGGKSAHALVKVNANSLEQYKERVEFLYNELLVRGIDIDISDKNCSRLSRFPSVERGNKKQELIAVNQGATSWNEWKKWLYNKRKEESKPVVDPDIKEEQTLNDTPILEQLDYLEERAKTGVYLPYETGWKEFDKCFGGGLITQTTFILNGGSGRGKTTLALNLGTKLAKKRPVLYYSLEMSREKILSKIISNICFNYENERELQDIDSMEEYRCLIQANDILRYSDRYLDSRDFIRKILNRNSDVLNNLHIIECNNHEYKYICNDVENRIIDIKERTGQTPIIFIDYLQYLTSSEKNEDPITRITNTQRQLKELAKKYDTIVFLLGAISKEAVNSKVADLYNGRDTTDIAFTSDYCAEIIYTDYTVNKPKENKLPEYDLKKGVEETKYYKGIYYETPYRLMSLVNLKDRNGSGTNKVDFKYYSGYDTFIPKYEDKEDSKKGKGEPRNDLPKF